MSIIEDCKRDLEKLLGLDLDIRATIGSRGEFESLTEDKLYYTKSRHGLSQFQVISKDGTKYGKVVSSFVLKEMPGCCGILISTASEVRNAFRGKGVATRLNKFRKEIAAYLGYTVLLCTDVASNEPQRKVLAKNDWKTVHEFKNKRTGNVVNISVCDLGKE